MFKCTFLWTTPATSCWVDVIRRSRCWNALSHVTRMFLQTKCVIWVKPKRSLRGGKGESVKRSAEGSVDRNRRSHYSHKAAAKVSFSEHLKFFKCLSSHCKSLCFCFIQPHTKWTSGGFNILDVPFCYVAFALIIKHTHMTVNTPCVGGSMSCEWNTYFGLVLICCERRCRKDVRML